MRTKKAIAYTCDVCLQDKTRKEIYTFKTPVWSHTFRKFGVGRVDMCIECYEKFVRTVRSKYER